MRKISQNIVDDISKDRFYRKCCRASDGGCKGRVTIEHALLFKGRQIDKKFNLIPLCAFHHSVGLFQDGGGIDKRKNEWVALSRASEEELDEISKVQNMRSRLRLLTNIYGNYNDIS